MDKKIINCPHCREVFSKTYSKNRHIKRFHPAAAVPSRAKLNSRILCPLCADGEKQSMATYIVLIRHLLDQHGITVEDEKLSFSNPEEFENWRKLEQRNVDYIKQRTRTEGYMTETTYICNRSNDRGFKSNCTKYMMKKGGSIKINGICPSRIMAEFYSEGKVEVRFIKTHVGHSKELRSRRLTAEEKKVVSEQLKAGVPWDKIITDAQEVKNGKLERSNLLRRDDLKYLSKINGIDKTRDPNYVKATSNKVQERNSNSVKEIMWKVIGNIERPHANSCRDRRTAKTHKKVAGLNLNGYVKMEEFGKFKVKSTSGEDSYSVVCGDVEGNCKCVGLFCTICEICMHKYVCKCVEYSEKKFMCEHVHMVSLYEKGVSAEESILAVKMENEDSKQYCIEETSQEEFKLSEAANQIITEKCQDFDQENLNDETYMDIACEKLTKELKLLDIATFKKLLPQFMSSVKQLQSNTSTKRKMEKHASPQPQKKRRK